MTRSQKDVRRRLPAPRPKSDQTYAVKLRASVRHTAVDQTDACKAGQAGAVVSQRICNPLRRRHNDIVGKRVLSSRPGAPTKSRPNLKPSTPPGPPHRRLAAVARAHQSRDRGADREHPTLIRTIRGIDRSTLKTASNRLATGEKFDMLSLRIRLRWTAQHARPFFIRDPVRAVTSQPEVSNGGRSNVVATTLLAAFVQADFCSEPGFATHKKVAAIPARH